MEMSLSSNNSSTANDDGSIILGTQADESCVFRRPQLPDQRQSTSADKQNISRDDFANESDSQIDMQLHLSVNDSNSTERISIFNVEPQKDEEGRIPMTSNSIHDMETQSVPVDALKQEVEANATAKKQLARADFSSEVTGNSAINISDMETQNYTNDNEQQRSEKSEINIPNTTAKRPTMNVHDLETQNYTVDTAQNTRDTNAKKSMMNIHDLETQNYNVDTKNKTEIRNNKNKALTAIVNQASSVEPDIHDIETQKPSNNDRTGEDICDMETQFELDDVTNEFNSRAVKNKDKNNDMLLLRAEQVSKSGTNCDNKTKSPSVRSSTPGSLNLSSPGIDEDCPSSPLDQSAHLLETSELLEYFGDGIDKSEEMQKCNTSTPKPTCSKTLSKKGHSGDTASVPDNENREDNIYDIPTQCISRKLRSSSSDDFETDKEKNATAGRKVSKKGRRERSQSKQQINDDSETDAEEYLEEFAKKQGGSSEIPSKSHDENVENRDLAQVDPNTSVDSDDMFDMLTQRPDNHSIENTSDSPMKQQTKTNRTDAIIDDMAPTQKNKDKRDRDDLSDVPSADIDDTAPTQLILPRKVSPKAAIGPKDSSRKSGPDDVDNKEAPTQIVHANSNVSGSSDSRTPLNDCENIDYETASTQVIGEVTEKRNSTTSDHAKVAKSSKVDLHDTLERNLEEMFDDVNNDSIHEPQLMSTQCLEDILQSSQCNDEMLSDKSTVDDNTSTNSVPQVKSGKKSDHLSHNVKNSETNGKGETDETDSQNSDISLAALTAKRQENIMKDTREFIDAMQNIITSCQLSITPRKSKTKIKKIEFSPVVKFDRKQKETARSKRSKSDATTKDAIDDVASKSISGEENKRSKGRKRETVGRKKSVKRKDGTASKTSKQRSPQGDSCNDEVNRTKTVGRKKSVGRKNRTASKTSEQRSPQGDSCNDEVNHTEEENLTNDLDICAPSSSRNKYRDDDLLTRLPDVRISGTLSNPPSPCSSTSIMHGAVSKPDDATGKKNFVRPQSKQKSAQTPMTLHESDDDILTRLPAVRISGTPSNPPSPCPLTSIMHDHAMSKPDDAADKEKERPQSKREIHEKQQTSSRRRNRTENLSATNKSPLLSHDNRSKAVNPKRSNRIADTMLEVTNDSEDSDSSTSYKRFKQMADRMLNSEQDHLDKQDKLSISRKKKGTGSSLNVPKNSKQSADSNESEGLARSTRRAARYTNRQDNENAQPMEEAHTMDVIDKSTKAKTRSTAANRKRGLNIMGENTELSSEVNLKRRKADQAVIEECPVSRRSKRITAKTTAGVQSSNMPEDTAKAGLRKRSPEIVKSKLSENDPEKVQIAARRTQKVSFSIGSTTDENIDVAKISVSTRSRRKINAGKTTTNVNDIVSENTNEQAKSKIEKINMISRLRDKMLQITVNPIDDESAEVEMFMTRKVSSNVQDKNSSIREGSAVRTLRSRLNNESRKRVVDTSTTTDSCAEIERSVSPGTSDHESAQPDSIIPTKDKRGKRAKSAAHPLQETQRPDKKKEVIKKPLRVDRYPTNLTNDIVTKSSVSDPRSQNSLETNVSPRIRISRSKIAEKAEKIEMKESTRRSRAADANVSLTLNTSVDSALRTSTPFKTRRSSSAMNISSPSAARHRILFTGIAEDKYSKIVKMLGGCKMESVNMCTILVTDKVRRTYKFLCALGKGIPIVSIDWLHESESAAQFLDWENYILKDPAAEARFGFRLRKSLDKAKEKGLLVGYTIVLTPNIAPPPLEELKGKFSLLHFLYYIVQN
ncbi:Mediator of DNA damage checkpoint protein 1 [Harpegnathos saltator]|uniref:PAX-interacting protein 1 n=1 Tax=Harpegnathos saltator TaxID=610380 RepID=E2BFT8_HARSA|nr:Mediator of DNA damage checkpoint protein 1 [Harpegnathos saltator]